LSEFSWGIAGRPDAVNFHCFEADGAVGGFGFASKDLGQLSFTHGAKKLMQKVGFSGFKQTDPLGRNIPSKSGHISFRDTI
jgi:hypothetical protein